ncbi:MAG: amidase [Solirubrobacterales bacterium]
MEQALNKLTANTAIEMIKNRKISVLELIDSSLKQIEKLDAGIKAWTFVNDEGARYQARKLDESIAQGKALGRLWGIPVGIKDIYNTFDMPTAMGSPIWEGFTPGNDARVVSKLRLQDGIMLGKTVTAEFAVHYNEITSNPHNHAYSPGTSSSGSAAAVAASMVPVAMGTQTAGSTMRPASYCGIYGYKPSFGLVPRVGVLKTTDSLDTIGFFSRSVDDLELIFHIVRVEGTDYPISYQLLHDEKRQSPKRDFWRIALVRGPKWDCAEEYARQALLDYAKKIAGEKSIVVEEVNLDPEFDRAHEAHQVIYDRTLAYYFKNEYQQKSLVSDVIYEIISRGNQTNLQDYLEALAEQNSLIQKIDRMMEEYDAIITLSTSGEAPKGLASPDKPDSCLVWTMCHLPAINLPVFTGPNRLPFGAQIVARRYNDVLLLKLVKWFREIGLVQDVSYDFEPGDNRSGE